MLDHLDPSTGARFFRQHWNLKEQKRLEVHGQQERKKRSQGTTISQRESSKARFGFYSSSY